MDVVPEVFEVCASKDHLDKIFGTIIDKNTLSTEVRGKKVNFIYYPTRHAPKSEEVSLIPAKGETVTLSASTKTPKRILTIAYILNGPVVEYGACMFHRTTPTEPWKCRASKSTAVARLRQNPVTVPSYFPLREHLRKCVHIFGVSGGVKHKGYDCWWDISTLSIDEGFRAAVARALQQMNKFQHKLEFNGNGYRLLSKLRIENIKIWPEPHLF